MIATRTYWPMDNFDIKIFKTWETRWSGNLGTSRVKNGVYVIAASNAAGASFPELSYTTRVNYVDN